MANNAVSPLQPSINPNPNRGDEIEDVNARPEPHLLLQAVSGLAAQRKALVKSREEQHQARLERLEPEINRVFLETWAEAKQSQREMMREAHAEKRIRRLQEHFKQVRIAPRGLYELTDEELRGEVDHAIDEERKRSNFGALPGESEESWRARMERLHYQVEYVARMLYTRQLDTKVRYVEGFPANVLAWHPKFMPPSRAQRSRVGKCLQCRAKRMPCSQTVRVKYVDRSAEECTRCRRAEEPCIVKRHPRDLDAPQSYDWASRRRRRRQEEEEEKDQSGAAGAEFEALSDELWAMRYRDGRIMPMPSWHNNDHPENARDEDFEPRAWHHVLEGHPAKWVFSRGRSRRLMLPDDAAPE